MNISEVRALAEADMQAVDRLIQRELHSDVALVNQLGAYIINSGGKRMRPVLTVLAARACGYAGNDHIDLAAIVEFIHTATLLHDDVVDASELRRGRETANAIWGNEASVLVGDFLLGQAFRMMVEVGSLRALDILSSAAATIARSVIDARSRSPSTRSPVTGPKSVAVSAASCASAAGSSPRLMSTRA